MGNELADTENPNRDPVITAQMQLLTMGRRARRREASNARQLMFSRLIHGEVEGESSTS